MQKVIEVPGLERVAVGDAAILDVKPLGKSELRLLDVPKVQRATVDAPAVLDVKVIDEGHVLVTGLAPGQAKLTTVSAGGLESVTLVSVAEATQAVDAGESLLVVKRGASVEVAAPKLQRVAVGDAEIADIVATDKGLTLKGLEPGVTTLLLWHADGRRAAYQVLVQP